MAGRASTFRFALLAWTTTFSFILTPSSGNRSDQFNPNDWYHKYDEYPEYCSTPQEMATRSIPPLEQNPKAPETRLIHVSAVIRHGARTPYTSKQECWAGYWESRSSHWDCDLTTMLAPPSPMRIQDEEDNLDYNYADEDGFAMFLFEKEYDALKEPLENELGGTCQVGQLLLRGYEQELRNGKFLREAYLYDGSDPYEHDERMRLLDTSFTMGAPWATDKLYYRADDDQRTLMSGQVLLRGMLGEEVEASFQRSGKYPVIPLHTADRGRDILDANEHVCPKLTSIKEKAEKSAEYQAFNTSQLANELRDFKVKELGKTVTSDFMLDCLMTTICTDRPLPPPVDDFKSDSPNSMFTKLNEFDIQGYNLVMKYNDAEYAKLSMAPLWAEIMDRINPLVNDETVDQFGRIIPKLALFSGHDTTIMPLLATLGPDLWGDKDWAPYASMLLIEIHEMVEDGRTDRSTYKSSYAFRLLYNGKVLTSKIPGCTEAELCDVKHFTNIVNQFAGRDAECDAPVDKIPEVFHEAAGIVSTLPGLLLFLGIVVMSMTLGALASFVAMTGYLPCRRRRRRLSLKTVSVHDEEIHEDLQLNVSSGGYRDEPPSDDEY